jgi:energy-coupling factor transporter ATP-binding protein EcfA2
MSNTSGETVKEASSNLFLKGTTGRLLPIVRNNISFGARSRYHKAVRDSHRFMNVSLPIGSEGNGPTPLKIEKLFVDLRLAPSADSQRPGPNLLSTSILPNTNDIWQFLQLRNEDEGEGMALVISGPAGSGKTTLLQFIAFVLADNREIQYNIASYTPIYLSLRDHLRRITSNPGVTLGELSQEFFKRTYPDLKLPSGWFEQILGQGKAMVLLDGLNEAANDDQRRRISRWIDDQVRLYPKSRFIVTTRPESYQATPLTRALVVRTLPFNSAQVASLIKKLSLTGHMTSSSKSAIAGLLKRLGQGVASRALTSYPFTLMMIASLDPDRDQLPGHRVNLYGLFCKAMLRVRLRTATIHDQLAADQKRFAIMFLASQLMEREVCQISRADAMDIIAPLISRAGIYPGTAPQFLKELEECCGPLLEIRGGRMRFSHLTFQEYLAAAYWSVEKSVARDWRKMVKQAWWHGTLRFYAALADPTPIIQACLDVNNASALALAADLLDECHKAIKPDLRRAVEERIDGGLESSDPTLSYLAAEIRLTRRLKSLEPAGHGVEIDPDFVTCAEYQLFLNETRLRGRTHHPDHWPDLQYPRGHAGDPVLGMKGEDAAAFCAWLTERYGSDSQFRLPSFEEINHSLAPSKSLNTWYQEKDEYRLLRFTLPVEESYKRKLRELSDSDLDLPFTLPALLCNPGARDFARSLDRVLEGISSRPGELARALRLVRARARDLGGYLTRARDLVRTHNHDYSRVIDLGRVHDLARSLASDIEIAINIDPDLALDGDNEGESGFNVTRDISHALHRARKIALNLAGDTARNFNRLNKAEIVDGLSTFAIAAKSIYDLLTIAIAETETNTRQAARSYAARSLEYFCLHDYDSAPLGKRLLNAKAKGNGSDRKALLSYYWWLQMVIARTEGKLPAWEGIRIVRERYGVGKKRRRKPKYI